MLNLIEEGRRMTEYDVGEDEDENQEEKKEGGIALVATPRVMLGEGMKMSKVHNGQAQGKDEAQDHDKEEDRGPLGSGEQNSRPGGNGEV